MSYRGLAVALTMVPVAAQAIDSGHGEASPARQHEAHHYQFSMSSTAQSSIAIALFNEMGPGFVFQKQAPASALENLVQRDGQQYTELKPIIITWPRVLDRSS